MKSGAPNHKSFQEDFFRNLRATQICDLLELLPGIEFFIKDKSGRFVAISDATRQRLGIEQESDVVGRLDLEIHPLHASSSIRNDDLRVMRGGLPVVDRLETPFATARQKSWFLTTKVPLYANDGGVAGIIGIMRPFNRESEGAEMPESLRSVLAFVKEHYRERINVRELAKMAHVSPRHLNRKLRETLQMSAQEYIGFTRIRAASRELLSSSKSIQDIALDCGYYDQSSFTKMFRRFMGTTPRIFRRRHKGA